MLIDRINLNQLRVFDAVAELGSMTLAAQRLNLTQSGVSQHIRNLEVMLEVKLFDRVSQKLVPTSSAIDLFEACRQNFEGIEAALHRVQSGSKGVQGKVSIGMPIEFGNNILIPWLSEFCKLYPRVSLFLRVGFATEMSERLSKGELDFAFIDRFDLGKHVLTKAVFEEELLMVATPEYLKEKNIKNPKDKRDFEKLDYLAYQNGAPVVLMWLKEQFPHHHFDLNVRSYIMDVYGLSRLICEGLGAGVIPRYVADDLRQTGKNLIYLGNPDHHVINPIQVARLKGRSLLPAAAALKKFLMDKLKVQPSLDLHSDKILSTNKKQAQNVAENLHYQAQ